jgi:transcriptional regulator with XRE-family HTH domain
MAKNRKPGPRSVGPKDKEMGQRIRLRRVEQHISQSELGEKLGVSFQQIQKYEKGVNRVPHSRLQSIAAALDVPIGFFFGSNGADNKQQREVESLMFMDSSFSLRLLRAYAAIPDATMRRQFVVLMERVSGTGEAG